MAIDKLSSIQQLKLEHDINISTQNNNKADVSFSDILKQNLDESSVKFSKHAISRMQERGVDYTDSLLTDLNQAVEKARLKGAKDVVVIGSQNAFIVNVENNTVITTMNAREMKENIFTNIDSAVLI